MILQVEPAPRGAGYSFEDASSHLDIPRQYVEAIREGVADASARGVLADFPMVDVKVKLIGGSAHETDSSEVAFKIASAMAFEDGCKNSGPVLLEPVMALVCTMPDEYVGAVIGDLNGRRGRVGAMGPRAGHSFVEAEVPLAELFGYVGSLRSITQGRGDKTMQFLKYDITPKGVQDAVVLRLRGGY